MRKHHFYFGSLALAGLMVGCKPATPPPGSEIPATITAKSGPRSAADRAAAQQLYNQPDTEKPIITEVKGADAVAAAATAYSQEVVAFMDKRAKLAALGGKLPPLPPGFDPSFDPSRVHFEDPVRPRGADSPSASAAPAAATLPGAEHHGTPPELIASAPQANPSPGPIISVTPQRPDLSSLNKDPASNIPLLTAQPRPLAASDEIAQRLAKQIKDYPQDIASQLDFQLLQMLQGQSVPQLQTLAPLQAEDREMLSAVLDGLTNFRNALRADNNMLLSRKIRPMLETADRLRTQAELSIPTVALCTDVKGFGVYEPLEPARFPADTKEHRVIVYCEVENFSSQLDEQKRWETKLTQEVVLYTEQNGLEVWRDKTPARPIIDYSRNRRHDFFIVKMVRLPANLTIGRYLLKVTVTDQGVNRVAENAVPITIVAQ